MIWRHEMSSSATRLPAVAGQFYSDDPETLRREVNRCLAEGTEPAEQVPKALIAPHAGYIYSGRIAGRVYASLASQADRIRQVVLLGPSHHAAFRGLAASSASAFRTPLGDVAVDQDAIVKTLTLPRVATLDEAHRNEHCLEVQLPFLQMVLDQFSIVPLLVGEGSAEEVCAILDALWGGEETRIVISSDLSHYRPYDQARALDQAAAEAIEALDLRALADEQACGCRPIRGMLLAAKHHGLRCKTVDLRNSGDTAGRRDRVVGYGGFIFV